MPPRDHSKVVEPLVGEHETAIDVVSINHQSHFLTDKRFLSVKTNGRNSKKTVVDTLQLPLIGGTKIQHERSPGNDEEKTKYGMVSLFVALVALAIATEVDGALMGLSVLVGIFVGFMGLVLLSEGYNPKSGSVTLQMQSESGSVIKEVELREDQLEFAETVSRVVSTTIAQPEQATRTVGD